MDSTEILKVLKREKAATAESILEIKSLELFQANQELEKPNLELDSRVAYNGSGDAPPAERELRFDISTSSWTD